MHLLEIICFSFLSNNLSLLFSQQNSPVIPWQKKPHNEWKSKQMHYDLRVSSIALASPDAQRMDFCNSWVFYSQCEVNLSQTELSVWTSLCSDQHPCNGKHDFASNNALQYFHILLCSRRSTFCFAQLPVILLYSLCRVLRGTVLKILL